MSYLQMIATLEVMLAASTTISTLEGILHKKNKSTFIMSFYMSIYIITRLHNTDSTRWTKSKRSSQDWKAQLHIHVVDTRYMTEVNTLQCSVKNSVELTRRLNLYGRSCQVESQKIQCNYFSLGLRDTLYAKLPNSGLLCFISL